jgi:hypothetical protein
MIEVLLIIIEKREHKDKKKKLLNKTLLVTYDQKNIDS